MSAWVSIVTVNNGTKEPIRAYHNFKNQSIGPASWVCQCERNLCTQVITEANVVPNHIDVKMFFPRYECMGINSYVNNGIKQSIRGYHNCKTKQLVMLGGSVNVREFCVPEFLLKPMPFQTILMLGCFFPRYEGLCTAYIPMCVNSVFIDYF